MKYLIGIMMYIVAIPLMVVPIIGRLMATPLLLVATMLLISAISKSMARKTAKEAVKALATERAHQLNGPDGSNAGKNFGDVDKKWGVLCEIDEDLRRATQRIRRLGPAAQHELKTKFMTLNDKRYLDQIIQVIEAKYLR